MQETFEAIIEHLSQQLQGAQAHVVRETQRRKEIERIHKNPHGLDEKMHERRLIVQCLRKSREEVKLYLEAKFNEK